MAIRLGPRISGEREARRRYERQQERQRARAGASEADLTTIDIIITDILGDFDLNLTSSEINQLITIGRENLDLGERAVASLITNAIMETESFTKRFPGFEQRREAGYSDISVEEYLELEDTYRRTLQNAGLPKRFWDKPDDFARLIANDVSAAEFEDRVLQGYVAVQNADQATVSELERLYGLTRGDLAAAFLDPTQAEDLLQRRFAASQFSGAGAEAGFEFDQELAEELATSLDTDAAGQVAELAASRRHLAVETVGEGGQDITDTDVVRGSAGLDAGVAEILERRRRQRLAQFSSSGGALVTQGGVVGAGSAAS